MIFFFCETGLEAKKEAKQLIPDPSTFPNWAEKERFVMKIACQNKFSSCEHVQDTLLNSKSELATRDPKWGIGLDKLQTIECLLDCWPGQNWMGQI